MAAPSSAVAAIQVITLEYGPEEAHVLDLYTSVPLPDEPMSTVVMAHGGLWQGGSRSDLETLCTNIVTQSDGAIACASIDYRLSDALGGVCTGTGVDVYREQAHDLALAYSMLQNDAETLRLDPAQIHVGGHSAGAHLAHIVNLRWDEFAPPCNRSDGCPAAPGAIGLEGLYDIPAWDEYDAVRWQSAFACATRKAFGAPGNSPAACIDTGIGERCWDAGSPLFLAENATDLEIVPAGDALVIHSPGDDWGDIADSRIFGAALESAFPEIEVATDTQGICAVSQHNLVLRETSMADCIIQFVTDRSIPESTGLLNAGMNDAWFNPLTLGQGFFITVLEDIGMVFLAWFTYDTERPDGSVAADLGEPGHRWLTAFGPYSGDTATLDIEVTRGGVFNASIPAVSQAMDGEITLVFDSCNSGTVEYNIPSITRGGIIPIQRISDDNISRCETLR